VIVAANPADAEAVDADLRSIAGSDIVALFPQRETLPYEAAEHHFEVSGLRVETLEALFTGRARIIVTTARALQELADIPAGLAGLRTTLSVGDTSRMSELTQQLDDMGFDRAAMVEAVGEYSVRGGILDLFGFGAPEPVRIEFWGDEIVSIRQFDILDQRSSGNLVSVDVLPVDLFSRAAENRSGSGSGSVAVGGGGARRGGRGWGGICAAVAARRHIARQHCVRAYCGVGGAGIHEDMGAGGPPARCGTQAWRISGVAGRAVPEAGGGMRADGGVRPHRDRRTRCR
jgi:hypothetical protein